MDESGRRKRGNTSGSLKRSWSQQGWRERGKGGAIVEQRRCEKFQFYGWLKNRRWRLAGVKNYRGDSAGFARGRSSFSKPLITPPPFSSNIHSFIRAFRTPRPTYPRERNAARVLSVRRLSSSWKETRGAGEKGVGSDRIVYSGIVKGARSRGKLVVNSKLINMADRGYGIVGGIKQCL